MLLLFKNIICCLSNNNMCDQFRFYYLYHLISFLNFVKKRFNINMIISPLNFFNIYITEFVKYFLINNRPFELLYIYNIKIVLITDK
jgi:hypothetical protein